MLDERLYFFIHGMCTMFFLLVGFQLYTTGKTRLIRVLSLVLLVWAALEVKDLAFYGVVEPRGNFLSNLLILIDMVAVAACSCYVKELLEPGWATLKRFLLLLTPYLLAVGLYLLTRSEWVVPGMYLFLGLYAVGFILNIVRAVQRYNRQMCENYSNVDRLHVRWLAYVVLLLVIYLVSWIYSCIHSSWVADAACQLLLLGIWAIVVYYTRIQRVMILPPPLSALEGGQVLNSFDFRRELERRMVEERVWLNPRLTLGDLAMLIGTNRTYLSNYLNSELHTTFYDYVNGYRISEAVRILGNSPAKETMAEISEQCGFNSISTFRRVFLARTGCSFADYRVKMAKSRAEGGAMG